MQMQQRKLSKKKKKNKSPFIDASVDSNFHINIPTYIYCFKFISNCLKCVFSNDSKLKHL